MWKIMMVLKLVIALLCHLASSKSYVKEYHQIDIRQRSLALPNSTPGSHLSFNAFDREFVVILKELEHPPGLYSGFKLLDADDKDRTHGYISNTKYFDAFLSAHPNVVGSFSIDSKENTIMGHFDEGEETYFIENTDDNRSIIYRASDVVDDEQADNIKNSLFVPECPQKPSFFNQFARRKRHDLNPVKKNKCELKLVADYEFYKVIGNMDYYKAARHLINVVERVNKLFGSVVFGINRDNEELSGLGMIIKEIKIYNRSSTDVNEEHFNLELPRRPSGLFWANETLISFSRAAEMNSSCASILLTAKVFEDGILGLANVGNVSPSLGICAGELNGGLYYNTAVVSVKKKEGLMITRIFDLVFAHELGHLWGSYHDTENCVAENYSGGRFIMHSSSNTGYDQNNYRFSNCSIHSIWKLLYSVQPRCFVEPQKSYCGNGILEAGEECDSGGGRYAGADTNIKDLCCTEECKLKQGKLCSPRHSDCCSDNCDYLPSTHVCTQRNNDSCKSDAFCTGTGPVCPEAPPVENGTSCNDAGTCRNGSCLSYCEMQNSTSMPCICENISDSCYRCCKLGNMGKCKPVVPKIPLKEGAICIFGQCRKNVCEKEVTDVATHYLKLIKDINNTPGRKFIGEYAVFVVVAMTLFIWIPCAWFIHKKDVQKMESVMENRQQIEFVRGPKKINRQNGVNHESTTTTAGSPTPPDHAPVCRINLNNTHNHPNGIEESTA